MLRKPEKRRTLDEIVESGVRESYAALRGEAPLEVKKQIKAVVKPFVEPKASVPVNGTPKPADIDWAALERDAVRLSRLIDLLEREAIEQEDEELLILSLM